MWIAALRHTEISGEIAMLQATVSYVVEFALGHSPDEAFWVEVMDELVVKFQKLEEQHSQLEWPSARIFDMLLGPPSGRAHLADRLEKVAKQLGAELAARREADAGLEGLQTLATRIWDLVLDGADGPSSLVTSLFTVAELLEGGVNAAATNGVR
jgi:hypothetical protein